MNFPICLCVFRSVYSPIFFFFLFSPQCPSGFCVPPSGGEISLAEAINQFRKCYGDKQGKQFRVWVDRVLSTEIGPGTWLVKFHKWELSGNSLSLSLYIYMCVCVCVCMCIYTHKWFWELGCELSIEWIYTHEQMVLRAGMWIIRKMIKNLNKLPAFLVVDSLFGAWLEDKW